MRLGIDKFREYIKNQPAAAISLPTMLCGLQFVSDLWEAISHGAWDLATLNQLASSANGFEAVALGIVMLVLKDKNK